MEENQNIPSSEGETRVLSQEELTEFAEEVTVPEQMEAPAPEQPTGYRGQGTGRRESPFANSPYVMNHNAPIQETQRPRYVGPDLDAMPVRERKTPKRAKASNGLLKRILAGVAAVVLVAGSCAVTAGLVNSRWEDRMDRMQDSFDLQIQDLQAQVDALAPDATGNSVSGSANQAGMYSASQVYARNVRSVVLIESTITANVYGQTTSGTSTGSGFILSENGYVVTNFHVVEGANAVIVNLYDGSSYPAALVGYDSTNDIAVLKIEATGLDAVTLGSSNDLIVGDQVVAIGNPLGELTSTLTVGYVSAKERSIATDGSIISMIQTDAAINSGNSGGPLFNMKGEVVGITTAKYSGASSSGATIEGIGFAIPMDDVVEGIGELIEYGYIKSAYLGVMVRNMDASTAAIYGLPVGAYVDSVEEGYCAHRAGIRAKDIIVGVGDTKVENLTDLTRALREYEPGQVASITVYRAGQIMNFMVTLDERPQDTAAAVPETQPQTQQPMPEGSYEDWFNFFAPFFGYGNGD